MTVNHQDVTTIIIINIIIKIKSSITKSHHGEDKKGRCREVVAVNHQDYHDITIIIIIMNIKSSVSGEDKKGRAEEAK